MICLFLTRHHNQGLFLHLLHDVPDAFVTDHIRLLLGRDGFMPVFTLMVHWCTRIRLHIDMGHFWLCWIVVSQMEKDVIR